MLNLNKKSETKQENKPLVFIKKAGIHIGTFFLTAFIFVFILAPIMPQPEVVFASYNELEEQYTTTLNKYETTKTEYEKKLEELEAKKEELLQNIDTKNNTIDSLNSQIEDVNN